MRRYGMAGDSRAVNESGRLAAVCALAMVAALGARGLPSCMSRGSKPVEPVSQPDGPPGSSTASAQPNPAAATGGGWTLETTDDGTVRIAYDHAEVVTFGYPFWGKDWQWAGAEVRQGKTQGGVTPLAIAVEPLGLTIAGSLRKTGPGEMTVRYDLTAARTMAGVVGGGIEFSINAGVLSTAPKPQLLPDNRGWTWKVGRGHGLEVTFDGPMAHVFFERGDPNTIRAFFVEKAVREGKSSVTMKIRLPEGGTVKPSVGERYGTSGTAGWHRQTLIWDRWPIDLRFLNAGDRPAGRHGRVKAQGDKLVFDDGTEARFWGANVQAYALFDGSKDAIARQAERIAALGYNLVRLHHHDSAWVQPNVIDTSQGTSDKLDDHALDMLDWWFKCLKDQGVYVWIDLHVGRHFLKGDGIPGYAELERQNQEGRGFNYVNPKIEALMQRFAERYLRRTNRYTGSSYTDDPAVMGVLITNENDLTQHFGNLMLADKGNPVHQRMFEALAGGFAKRVGLPMPETLHTWAPGPSKIALNELEAQFDRRAIDHLHGLGVKVPITTTSYWGDQPLSSLPALATGDVIDVHSYGKAENLSVNPRFRPNFLHWIGAAHVAGKPLTVTEWNVEYPNRDRFTAPLYVSSVAALQGWDALMLYGYSQSSNTEPEKAEPWSTAWDPGITAIMPAAAVLFRQQHVRPAKLAYRLQLTRQNLYYEAITPDTAAAIRTLVEQSKLTVELPDIPELDWDHKPASAGKATQVSDLAKDFIPAGQNFIESDTGELRRDWEAGVHTINTPKSQAASGWIGGRRIALADVQLEVKTPKATVALTSLDSQPIARSERVLLTVVAQVTPESGDRLPFLAQPVEGSVSVRSSRPLRITPVMPDGRELPPLAARREGERLTFALPHQVATHWFLLKP